MSKAVMSYSSHDAADVLLLRDLLARAGVRIWLDRTDIVLGTNWQESIERAIKECDVLLVVLTDASVHSREVEAEWSLALRLGKRIVPVLLAPVEVPFRLAAYQHVVASRGDLAVAATQLASVLPRRSEPPTRLTTDSDAFHAQEVEPGRYATITLWLEDESLDMDVEREVLVDRQAFGSVKSLLDHLYLEYLGDRVAPYSYGAEWLLHGPWIVAPFGWLARPGTRLQDVELGWISETPLSAVFFEAGWRQWGITSGKHLRKNLQRGIYGVRANSIRLINALSYHPKTSQYLLSSKELFEQLSPLRASRRTYKHSLVAFADKFYELGGKAFVETKRAEKNPKILEKIWGVASHLE